MKTLSRAALGLLAVTVLSAGLVRAVAQDARRANPGDSRAAASAAKPDSAFSGYKPFQEQQVRSWKDANQEVADNPGMGSMGAMGSMPGMNMPGMDSKGGAAAGGMSGGAMSGMNMPGMDSKGGAAAGGKSGGAMPGMNMPGMDSKGGAAAGGKSGGAMAGMNMPGMDSKRGAAAGGKSGGAMAGMGAMPGMDSKGGHAEPGKPGGEMAGMGAMPGMASKPGGSDNKRLTGTGVVRLVDKAAGRIRLTHDPIAAVGWPQMTIVFRVKDGLLADQIKQGDKVEFSLVKSAAGYMISELRSVANRPAQQTK